MERNCRCRYLLDECPIGETQTHSEGKGQRWIAYGGDLLVAGEVVELGIGGNPGQELVASAKIELGITGVEVPIGQQQRVPFH